MINSIIWNRGIGLITVVHEVMAVKTENIEKMTMVTGIFQTTADNTPADESTHIAEEVQPLSTEPIGLELVCESESDTTAMLSWTNMFLDGSGTYDIYLDSVLIQDNVTETAYTLTNLEAANTYNVSVRAVDQDGEIIETSNDISVITDLVVTKDIALWEETTVEDLYVNGGTLNLNEQILHVNGNVVVSNGTFKINGGTADIRGDLRIQTKNADSNGNISYANSYGYLNMTNENDYVKVGKDFVTYSRYSHNGCLTEGTIEVKGDFTQISGDGSNYYASGNHRTILSGDKLQTVSGSSTNMHFATLELLNFSEEGVHFNQAINSDSFIRNGCNVSFENAGVLGWRLEDDEEYNGDLNLIGDTLDLNGHTLTVNGDLTQSGGEIKINGGELVITGDYKMQTSGNGASSGRLNMTNEADKVTVKGSFATRSTVDHTNLLTAGTMEIGGSLYIRNGTLDLNGHKIETTNDVAVGYYGTLYINNGQLYVGKDLRIQDNSVQNDGTVSYGGTARAYLQMTQENDFVKVSRNLVMYSYYSHSGYLTNGILEVKGNFSQISGDSNNFYATGEHKVVLSGTKQQNIDFASENSNFNILEINKPLSTGYVFNRIPVWNQLIETAADVQAPTAPNNLKSDMQTVTSVSLKWNESTDNNAVAGYDIYRNGVRVGSTNKPEFIDDRLKSNTSYTYYVIAYDAMHNESDWSNIIEVKTLPDENAPTQPTGLKVKSQTSSSVVLNWTASTDNSKVEGYDVYRNDVLIGTVNGTSFADNSISSGLYVYYIKAFDDTDNYSEASETVTVDTEAPTSPVLEIESSTNTQAVISWNCTDNVGVEKYEIFRNSQKIVTVTETTYTDKNLSYDENYEYY